MEGALAVVAESEGAKRLVRETGELAAGVGADLVVYVTSGSEFADRADALTEIPDAATAYTVADAEEGARQYALDIAKESPSELDVEYEAVGRLGDRTDQVVAAAEEFGCEHVFVVGRQHSPARKAVFGDVAQSVALTSDSPVTVVTG